ncbi:alkaline phosphatase family protein [Novosphingobium sp.]|uniref:alkaline phosphatase family protein n=1 Tax=Novosphingobium sp. TaxID=1874826 RepID=UPI0038620D1A
MRRLLIAVLALLAFSSPALARPVLLISIDGLRPGDVLEADKRGLKIPTLRRFVRDGAYASGVRGVLPSLTYPSHTTILTGTSPARHGIVANQTFDPLQINASGWYWYARDIKVPTLWEAAKGAGLSVGNVHWPVSVGAAGIDWNLPQIWRSGHADDAKLLSALATPGLFSELEAARGEPYAQGIVEDIGGDENRARYAISLIERHAPQFLTVYYTAYDHQQHQDGPDTASAHAVLERIDAAVATVIAAERKAHPDAVIALVSDHGFAAVTRTTNLFRAFIDNGLITLGPDGKVQSWKAMPWPGAGSAAIILAQPDDAMTKTAVAAVLAALQCDPQSGIVRVADAAEIAALGGNPAASFYVNFKIGTSAGSFADQAEGLYGPARNKGTHGWFPAAPEMRASFMIVGPGIPKGRALGEIDQRAIAPTLAAIMGAAMPMAELPALRF